MNSRSFSSWNREKFDLEAPPLPLLNGGLLFSFSKSLKGNRVNLFSGEGKEGWERRQFRNNTGRGPRPHRWKKACTAKALYRDVDRKISSSDSFVDAGRARAIESKGFPVCCSSIGGSLRRIPIRFQSLGNAFAVFLYFSFSRPRNLFRIKTRNFFANHFDPPRNDLPRFFWREKKEEEDSPRRNFTPFSPTSFFFFFFETNINNVNFGRVPF